MLPGGKLHPDLVGPPGVEGDVRKAEGTVFGLGLGGDAVFQNGLPHPLAGLFYREDPALAAVLEEIVPQKAFGGEGFVRAACKDSPVLFEERGRGGFSLGPAVEHGIGFLTLGDLTAEGRSGSWRFGIDHQAADAHIQPMDDAHVGVGGCPQLTQPGGHALLAGKSGRLIHHHEGGVFVYDETHSLPSSSSAFNFSTPAMVLPSLISPLITIS